MKEFGFFILGLAIGGATVWFYQEKKYESLIEEEVSSVKETFDKEKKEMITQLENKEQVNNRVEQYTLEKPSISEYVNLLDKKSYTSKADKPYEIDQENFNEFEDYNCATLDYYFQDNILADADFPDDPIDDVEEIVGDCLKKDFDDTVEDWMYVRNDAKKTDYEIYINPNRFSEREY